jgi:hypothetical protein
MHTVHAAPLDLDACRIGSVPDQMNLGIKQRSTHATAAFVWPSCSIKLAFHRTLLCIRQSAPRHRQLISVWQSIAIVLSGRLAILKAGPDKSKPARRHGSDSGEMPPEHREGSCMSVVGSSRGWETQQNSTAQRPSRACRFVAYLPTHRPRSCMRRCHKGHPNLSTGTLDLLVHAESLGAV